MKDELCEAAWNNWVYVKIRVPDLQAILDTDVTHL
jgi:hypothetical protein